MERNSKDIKMDIKRIENEIKRSEDEIKRIDNDIKSEEESIKWLEDECERVIRNECTTKDRVHGVPEMMRSEVASKNSYKRAKIRELESELKHPQSELSNLKSELTQAKAELQKELQNEQQKARNEEFWATNKPLKAKLESDKVTLNKEISTLKKELSKVSKKTEGYTDMIEFQKKVQHLTSKKEALSLLKFKEKRVLQTQIDSTNKEIDTIQTRIKLAEDKIQKHIDTLYHKIHEIDTDLTKPR